MDPLPPELVRAAVLSGIPGVTLAEACTRFGVKKSALVRARKALGRSRLQPSPENLVIAALTDNGRATAGRLPDDLGPIASWVDYVNHDGCDAAEVGRMLASLAGRGVFALTGRRWKLVQPWPSGTVEASALRG